MKTIKVLAIGLVVSATAMACSPSQRELTRIENPLSGKNGSSRLDFQKIEKNYLVCLGSANSGVVESALGQLILLRVAFPQADLREIQTRLFDLSTRGCTMGIRQKAFVAMRVFADPEAFKTAVDANNATDDEILAELVSRLER